MKPLLQHDLFMLGSAGIYFDDGQVHPRVYGSVGQLPGPLVRDRGLMTLEQAAHRMSGDSAQRFRKPGRGVVAENHFADLVLFDPDTIASRATCDASHQPASGVETAIANGQIIIDEDSPLTLKPAPGRTLRACDHHGRLPCPERHRLLAIRAICGIIPAG